MKPPKDEIPEGMKWCPRCEQIHPLRQFYKQKETSDGLRYLCKECLNRMPSRKKAKREQVRKYYASGKIPWFAKL